MQSLNASDVSALEKIDSHLQEIVTPQQYRTWFQTLKLVDVSEDEIHFSVPNDFIREWISCYYPDVLDKVLLHVLGHIPGQHGQSRLRAAFGRILPRLGRPVVHLVLQRSEDLAVFLFHGGQVQEGLLQPRPGRACGDGAEERRRVLLNVLGNAEDLSCRQAHCHRLCPFGVGSALALR